MFKKKTSLQARACWGFLDCQWEETWSHYRYKKCNLHFCKFSRNCHPKQFEAISLRDDLPRHGFCYKTDCTVWWCCLCSCKNCISSKNVALYTFMHESQLLLMYYTITFDISLHAWFNIKLQWMCESSNFSRGLKMFWHEMSAEATHTDSPV